MPRNSGTFWRSLLRKKLPSGCLGAVRFTTFGLGDSMYIKYVVLPMWLCAVTV